MIKMTNGYTFFGGTLISDKTGPVEFPAEVEKRLVSSGVAEYVIEEPEPVEAPIQSRPEPPEEGEPDLLSDMSFDELKALASEMGIDTKGMRSKASVIAAIEEAKPPDLKVIE